MMSKTAAAEMCLEGLAPRFSARNLWATLSETMAKLHCQLRHQKVSLPVHGKYRCWTCLREFDTTW